jgi:hypothetical protein
MMIEAMLSTSFLSILYPASKNGVIDREHQFSHGLLFIRNIEAMTKQSITALITP